MQKLQSNIIYPKVRFKDVFGAFWCGIKPQKWKLFTVIGSVIVASIAITITPIFYKQFFDIIAAGGDRDIIAPRLVILVIYGTIFNGIFWLGYRIATFCNNYYQPATMANLKQQAYDYVMEHSYGFFTNNFTGSLVQKVNRFARAYERLSDDLTWHLLPLIVKIISILVVLFFVNKWIALIVLIWATVFLGFNIVFSKWKLKYDLQTAAMDSKTTAYLADTITNQNTVSLFARLGFESRGYKKVTDEHRNLITFTSNLDALIDAGQGFLSFAIQFILFFVAIKYWQKNIISVGVFFLIEIYLINLIDQLWGFTRMVRSLYQGYADAKEMVEIMLLSHEIKDVSNAKELFVEKGKIDFKDLSFNFNETRKVLKNINLVIKPGEKVALIGPSGAGKTTFVRLLLRLYSPTEGKILIDGQNISEVTQESLRKNISLVPQDPVLFHRTLADNIAYGKHSATKEEIEKAANLAHCDEFIKDLPFGFETYVGERGIKLSGGERQRVAIARAILKNAPILILDEATSSLDSHSEMLIQDALHNLMLGKTTIVIAHRLSTIQKMDRIIVVDNGRIVEQGSHSELLVNENSLYKKLWTLQAGGFLARDEESEKKDIENIETDGTETDGNIEEGKQKYYNKDVA